jgi:hypothetical protein
LIPQTIPGSAEFFTWTASCCQKNKIESEKIKMIKIKLVAQLYNNN